MRSLALTSIALLLSACSGSLEADLDKTPECRLEAPEGTKAIDLELEALPAWETSPRDPDHRRTAVYIDLTRWPKSRELVNAVLRIRLREGTLRHEDGRVRATWQPKVLSVLRALELRSVYGAAEEPDSLILEASVSHDPRSIWRPAPSTNRPGVSCWNMRLAPALSDLGPKARTYGELLENWNDWRGTTVKQNGLWLEILMTRSVLEARENGSMVLLLDGPIEPHPSRQESYFWQGAPKSYLEPHLHLLLKD